MLCEGVRILRLGIFSLCSTFWALSCMLMNYPWTPTHLYSQISFISNCKLQWERRAKISKCARTCKRNVDRWRIEEVKEKENKIPLLLELVNRLQKIEQGRFFQTFAFCNSIKKCLLRQNWLLTFFRHLVENKVVCWRDILGNTSCALCLQKLQKLTKAKRKLILHLFFAMIFFRISKLTTFHFWDPRAQSILLCRQRHAYHAYVASILTPSWTKWWMDVTKN